MKYNFDEEINRKDTNDLKWHTKPIEGYLNITPREDMIPMWIADMDFKSPDSVYEALKRRVENGVFGYCAPQEDYYQSIQYWMKERHDVDVDVKSIQLMPSVVGAINVGIRILSNKGDGVIIQPPVYNPFHEIVERAGRVVVENTLINNNGHYEIDFELFEQQAKREDVSVFILCSPHNPVGRVWKRWELEKINEICLENNVSVISDEIHSDIVFGDNKHIVYSSISDDAKKHSIVCTSPGKTFNVSGLKISNIFIDDQELREAFSKKCLQLSLDIRNTFGIEAIPAAYSKEGILWLNGLIEYLSGNVEFIENYIKDNLPGVRLVSPEGTFLSWLDLSNLDYSDDELLNKFALEAGVVCVPGIWFGESGSKFMRLNMGTTRKNLEIAFERLKEVLY